MPVPADYRELDEERLDPRRIEALWAFEASSAGEHLVLPDGRMDLLVRYRLDARGRIEGAEPMIVGPSTRATSVAVGAGDRFLGLRFRAGWGGVCLHVSPSALKDSALTGRDAAHALGRSADGLLSARGVDDLRSALLAAGHDRPGDGLRRAATERAIDLLHLAGERLQLPDLARALGLPERTLRRHVLDSVGLSVKALSSVIRFQRTVRLLSRPRASGMTSGAMALGRAALEGGYSDQAHMTREFRRHGGFTPGRRPAAAFGSLPLGLAESFKTRGNEGA